MLPLVMKKPVYNIVPAEASFQNRKVQSNEKKQDPPVRRTQEGAVSRQQCDQSKVTKCL